MAKKSKRPLSNRPAAVATSQTRSEFNPDYSAVKKDLKTIGALAGFFIIVLVTLSFFLR